MSPRWLKFLEKFGLRGKIIPPSLGEEDLDRLLEDRERFARYDALFYVYGPIAKSPWVPYQCPTLFASIDKLQIKPKEIELSSSYREAPPQGAWRWLGPETMVIVDLPGATTIEVGAMLMREGAQFISTFDHWPSSTTSRGVASVIDAGPIIDAMFTLGPEVHRYRKNWSPEVAPIWLCDSRRLGLGRPAPSPGTFDNRYFIDDSILAGINTLKKAGIRHVVYFSENVGDEPLPDLVPFMIEASDNQMSLQNVALSDMGTWIEPEEMAVPFKRKLPIHSFRRSDMGGFGQMVPLPSEGSYSSGGGGG